MASGNTLAFWTAVDAIGGTATFDARAMPTGVQPVLDFDASTDETAVFQGFMPRHYANGGVTVTIGWMATSPETTGNVIWDVAFKSITDDADDLDTKAFAAVNSSSADATATVNGEVAYTTVTFTDGADMDSVTGGEFFHLFINRDANNGSDTLTVDAELCFIEIRET